MRRAYIYRHIYKDASVAILARAWLLQVPALQAYARAQWTLSVTAAPGEHVRQLLDQPGAGLAGCSSPLQPVRKDSGQDKGPTPTWSRCPASPGA